MKTSVGFVSLSCKEHKHNCYEIIFYRDGFGTYYFEGGSISISPGKFIIVPPGVVHASKYEKTAETFFVNGDFNHIFSFSVPTVVMDNSEEAGRFLMELIFKNRFSTPEYLYALSNALAHFLLQNIKTEKDISIALQDIVTKITDNFYDSSIDVGEILRKSGYAVDYIRYQFKSFTGKTPVKFLTEVRISHACYLINAYQDTISLTEIAEKCGYTDYVYFSRKFKEITGVSPKNYLFSS